MFFKIKPSKVIVDCFVVEPLLKDMFPVQKANRFYPEWWKLLPNTYVDEGSLGETGTMKGCTGFTDYFKYSFVVPMWSDFKLRVDESRNFVWQFADGKSNLVLHDARQRHGFMPDHAHIKFIAPWQLLCKDDVNFVVTQPVWNNTRLEKFIVPTGVVNFKYQHNVNINLFFPTDKAEVSTFEAGQPVLTIVPMTEKEVVFNNHVISEEEWLKMNNVHSQVKFFGKYRFMKKQYESEGRCPFNFSRSHENRT